PITVQWEGVPYPTRGDWIGVYTADETWSYKWLGYKYVTESPTWAEGRGNITFHLVNIRLDYQFKYMVVRRHSSSPIETCRDLPSMSWEAATFSGRGRESPPRVISL